MGVSPSAMLSVVWKQHPGALPHPVTACSRFVHQMVERKTCPTSNGTPCPTVPHSQSPTTIETVPAKVAPPSSCIPSSMPHTIFQDGLHQTRSCSGPTLQSQAGHRGLVHHTTCNVLLHKVGTFRSRGSQSIRSSLGLSRFTTSLTRIRRVSGHCRRLLVKQGLPFQKGIPKPAQTWATRLDKAKRLTVHAKLRDLRFQPTSLDRAFQTRHSSHHQIIHQLISKNLRGRYLPLWRQTSLFFENLLPVLVLPSHRKNFSGSLHFRTGPPRSLIHRRISCQSSTSTTWKILPLGGRTRTAIASWLYPGKKEERVSQWPTHHLLCGLPVSSYAQHPRQNDLSTDPSGMSKSLCFWGCIHTAIYPSSNLHPSTQISFWWIRTLLVSSPALIKIVSSVHGSCS